MSETLIAEAAASGIWTLLAVALLIYTIKTSDEREKKLMDHLDKTNESHKEITESNRQMAKSMAKLENRMDEGFNKVWERIDQKNEELR